MPTEVKAYKCSHGCTRRILQDKSEMARHEKTCFLNPETRSCRTCVHDLAHGYDFDEKQQFVHCSKYGRITPVSDCPFWVLKF